VTSLRIAHQKYTKARSFLVENNIFVIFETAWLFIASEVQLGNFSLNLPQLMYRLKIPHGIRLSTLYIKSGEKTQN
jgi:hypothetical protein